MVLFCRLKLVALATLLFWSVSHTIAQEIKTHNSVQKLKPIVLCGKINHLPLYRDYQPVHSPINSPLENVVKRDSIDYYVNHWNNTSFLINWKETVTYPFVLHFDEDTFSAPVEGELVVTSRFGWRHGRPHRGIDIDLQTGDNVLSILEGKVRYAGVQRGYGKTVVIRHKNGLETVYAHLSEISVRKNDLVRKGEILGKGGTSGNARGSHLHLEVHYKGKAIHPEYLFDFSEKTEIRADKIAVIKKWTTPRLHKSTKQSNIVVYQEPKEIAESDIIPVEKVYVVKKGDTLHRIANEHNLNVSDICKKNAIDYNSVLNIGQEIVLF